VIGSCPKTDAANSSSAQEANASFMIYFNPNEKPHESAGESSFVP
jgi:hypothetical protein